MKLIRLIVGLYKGHINKSKYRDLYVIINITKLIFYYRRFDILIDGHYSEFKYQNYATYHVLRFTNHKRTLLSKFHTLRLHHINSIIDLCTDCGTKRMIRECISSGSKRCDYCGSRGMTYRIRNIRQFRPTLIE